jgi:hypothetical protein
MYTGNAQIDNGLKKMESFFDEYLGKKAPAFPSNIKQGIVKFGPWVLVVLLIIGFFGIFAGLGLTLASIPVLFAQNAGQAILIILTTLLALATFIMQAIAVPGLFKTKKSSWYLVYYATLLGFIQSLLVVNIVSGLIFTAIGLYILFQIKSYYRN